MKSWIMMQVVKLYPVVHIFLWDRHPYSQNAMTVLVVFLWGIVAMLVITAFRLPYERDPKKLISKNDWRFGAGMTVSAVSALFCGVVGEWWFFWAVAVNAVLWWVVLQFMGKRIEELTNADTEVRIHGSK